MSLDSDVDVQPARSDRVRRLERTTPWVLIVGGVLGLVSAFVLTQEKIAILTNPDYRPACDINPVLSCGSVIVTKQASVFGFPNPVMGLVGFAVVITIGVVLASGVRLPRWIWLGLNAGAVFGLGFVAWLVSQSLYSIGALCPWCLVVWTATIPIVVYVTVTNAATGNFGGRFAESSASDTLVLLRNWIVVGTYLVIGALIFVRWMDFWLGRGA